LTAKKVVFMFSGQGSQYFQMGQALFAQDAVFRDWMLRLDAIVRDCSGHSVIEALYAPERSKADNFTRMMLTHPAIFMVEYSLAQSLIHANVLPDITLGASLGSFAAAAVAGFVSVEDAATAVIRQATVIEACCEPGGMIAILASPRMYEEDFLRQHSELAGVNFASHFVVSSKLQQLDEIEKGLRERAITYQRLPVSFAFHSQWIERAREAHEPFMQAVQYQSGRLPLMCCERAELVTSLPNDYFWRIARNAIRFNDAVVQMERRGTYRYVDVGPAGTLATFLKYSLLPTSESTMHSVLTPYGNDLKNRTTLLASIKT